MVVNGTQQVFCIFGQPLCIMLYVHDYVISNKIRTAAVAMVINATVGASAEEL